MIERTPLTCHDRLCSQAYVVPASDVFFLISVPARNRQLVTSIRDTIAPLPEGSTAVPYTTGADVGAVARAMRRADLAISKPVPQPGTQQMVLSTDPKPGTVLRRGSTVQLHVDAYTSWTSSSPATMVSNRTWGIRPSTQWRYRSGTPVWGSRNRGFVCGLRVKSNMLDSDAAVASNDWSPMRPRRQLSSMKRRMDACSSTL